MGPFASLASNRSAGSLIASFPCTSSALAPLVARTAGGQRACSISGSADHQTVRHPRACGQRSEQDSGLNTHTSRAMVFSLCGKLASPCGAWYLLFHLLPAHERSFRLCAAFTHPALMFALHSPRCAIRGHHTHHGHLQVACIVPPSDLHRPSLRICAAPCAVCLALGRRIIGLQFRSIFARTPSFARGRWCGSGEAAIAFEATQDVDRQRTPSTPQPVRIIASVQHDNDPCGLVRHQLPELFFRHFNRSRLRRSALSDQGGRFNCLLARPR